MKIHPQLRRQILEDILGDNVDVYENFNKEDAESKKQHRQRIPLWKFLLHLLNRDESQTYIKWNKDFQLEFFIKDTVAVAELWGSVKNKTDMTYEKLGRAMRYYYGKSIIEKVAGRRYSYRFILSRRTKKNLAQFVNVADMEMVLASSESDNDNKDEETSAQKKQQRLSKTKSLSNTHHKEIPSAENHTTEMPCLIKLTQSSSKTKIFRPNESILQDIPSSDAQSTLLSHVSAEKKNTILYKDDNFRRSAFIVPPPKDHTNSRMDRLLSLPSMPSPNQLTTNPNFPKRKRSYPFREERCNTIAFCCCGSHNIKLIDSVSDGSECNSNESISPLQTSIQVQDCDKQSSEYFPMNNSYTETNEDFILRRGVRDYWEREESQLEKLKKKLGLTLDPFMGYNGSLQGIDDFFLDSNLYRP